MCIRDRARFEAFLRRDSLQIDGWVVNKTKVMFRSGSAQKTVPVAPPCPKLPGERKSPKNPQQEEGASRHPRPQRIATFWEDGIPVIGLVWSVVIAFTAALRKTRQPSSSPPFRNIFKNLVRSATVENIPPQAAPKLRQ